MESMKEPVDTKLPDTTQDNEEKETKTKSLFAIKIEKDEKNEEGKVCRLCGDRTDGLNGIDWKTCQLCVNNFGKLERNDKKKFILEKTDTSMNSKIRKRLLSETVQIADNGKMEVQGQKPRGKIIKLVSNDVVERITTSHRPQSLDIQTLKRDAGEKSSTEFNDSESFLGNHIEIGTGMDERSESGKNDNVQKKNGGNGKDQDSVDMKGKFNAFDENKIVIKFSIKEGIEENRNNSHSSGDLPSDHSTVEDSTNSFSASLIALPSNWKYMKMQELVIAKEEGWKCNGDVAHIIRGTCAADFTQADLYHITDFTITHLVKQHCELTLFKKLPKRDKLLLIQQQLPQLLLLRQEAKFDSESCLIDTGYPGRPYVNFDIMKLFSNDYYKKALKLKSYYRDYYRSHPIINLIISAIAFFDPCYHDFIAFDALTAESNAYKQILKEYLQSAFGEKNASMMFTFLEIWMNNVRLFMASNTLDTKHYIHPEKFHVSMELPFNK